jgi:hypothetical protein
MMNTIKIFSAFALFCFLTSFAMAMDSSQKDNREDFSLFSADNAGGDRDTAASLPSSPDTPGKPWVSMTEHEKRNYYLVTTFGPKSSGFSLAGAGIAQARDSVPERGQGMEGFSKRLGSAMSQKIVENTFEFGLGSLLHEDPRYYPSDRPGLMQRVLHAAEEEFIARKDSGGTRIGYTGFIATTAGVIVSRQWYPKADRTAGQYLSSIAISTVLGAAKNIFDEFWPDIKKRLHH